MGRHKAPTTKNRRIFVWCLLAGALFAVVVHFQRRSGPPLEPWHTEILTEEFTAKKIDAVSTFDEYRRLEDRLFAQLAEKVYARTRTGPEYELVRYSTGSAADLRHRKPDWNRSFEFTTEAPRGGVLLLHGMSDSPYSLRALGQALSRRNYWVVGLRLPGHGTAPSGLRNVRWEDMAAAVRIGVARLAGKVGGKPVHLVGYSNGAALALHFTLDALEGYTSPVPAGLVLISPAIGVHPAAGLAGVMNRLSLIPGLGSMAWLSIEPEFDPYKYNSFAANAGNQVHRLTRLITRRIASWASSETAKRFPPILVFKSTVDATVSTDAVIERLLRPLGENGNELVLFDINRLAAATSVLVADPGPLTERLMADEALPFAVTLVTNANEKSRQLVARHKTAFAKTTSEIKKLRVQWPSGVISLSHVALPFPPDDPLYGQSPPDNGKVLFLGNMAIRGERGLLKIPYDSLIRLRHNPFYYFLERRALDWIEHADAR